MANSNSNVVAFDSAYRREGMRKPGEQHIISECRSLITDHFNDLLHGLFLRLDDELFKHSERAESNALQSLYFDAMRYVRKEKETLQNQCLQAYLAQYDDFWENATRGRALSQTAQQPSLEEAQFSLVENETLE